MNWNDNLLTVEGDASAIAAFRSAALGADNAGVPLALSLERLFPTPPGLGDRGPKKIGWDDSRIDPKLLPESENAGPNRAGMTFKLGRFPDDYRDGWRNGHWGCQAELRSEDVKDLAAPGDANLTFNFASALGSPFGVVEHASRSFPTLLFRLLWTDGSAAGLAELRAAVWLRDEAWEGRPARAAHWRFGWESGASEIE